MNVRNKRCLVIGVGRSGLAAAKLLCARGAKVVLNDKRPSSEIDAVLRESVEALGATLAAGSHNPSAYEPAVFDGIELVVLSPGVPEIPELASVFARAEVIAEVELAARFLRAPIVGVTGTNGKSTVTTLVGEMLKRSGFPTFVGGNLGVAACEAIGTEADVLEGRVVLELSSFQLERVHVLKPKVAVLLNVTPDHLDRYSSTDDYAAAKANIFAAQGKGDHAVVPAGDPLCAGLVPRERGITTHEFGAGGQVRVNGEHLVDAVSGWSIPTAQMLLRGRHNELNAAAAVLAARLLGATSDAIEETLREVGGLPHRAEFVRELGGVAFVDDSKATNVGAAVAALDGLASPTRRAVMILGGVDKGGSYDPLVARLREVGRGVVLIGAAAELIERALAPIRIPVRAARSMEEAVAQARALAEPGDVVLLAPACASFDMFRSYAHRGDVFQDAVRALGGGGT